MQIVIERAGLHSERFAAHQACRIVRDARRVIATGFIAQCASEAGQLRGGVVCVSRRSIGRIGLRQDIFSSSDRV